MTALFELGPNTTTTTRQQWLAVATDLRDTLDRQGDCFVSGWIDYAADLNVYPPSVDPAALSRAIDCVQAGQADCSDPSSGFAVPIFEGTEPGATAICADGTYSYSAHDQGTCSHHGGVQQWLK